jgi:hypothetical protein
VSHITVVIVEPSQIVANIIRRSLEESGYRCVLVREPAAFDAALGMDDPIGVVLLDVLATMTDTAGYDRPLWQILAERPPLPMPVLCFTGTNSTPTDTPLFSAPPETMTIASPADFNAVTRIMQGYLALMQRQPLLATALAGKLLPSLRGTVREFSFESLLQLVQMGDHSGTLILRDGLHTGIIAFEAGQVVHALAGALTRKEAVFTVFKWTRAHFAFYRGLALGEHTITDAVENLILEATRLDDEVTDLALTLPPNSYIRRVRGYTDQLPGKEFSIAELEVLAMVDDYHIVRELVSRSRHGEIVVMKALRALLHKGLIEIVPLGDPRYLVAGSA